MPSCINLPFRRLSKSRRQVGYVLLTRAPVAGKGIATSSLPLDLHVLGLSLAFILSQDQTLHSNKNFKNYLFRSVIISVESLLGLALAVCFKPFNIFKNSFCFSFTRPTYEAKADAKINTFTYSLQIFPHFFSNFFFGTAVEESFCRLHPQKMKNTSVKMFQNLRFVSESGCKGKDFFITSKLFKRNF